jgi:hypothetical protein
MSHPAQTEIEKERAVWWAEHFTPGMSASETFRLIEEIVRLNPATLEERARKAKEWEAVPEFVL